jgi:putative ABC transport system permease protein
MQNLISDFRRALRGLRAQPAFSITAVLTLALGIGLTTTIFGVVNGIVLRPLDFRDAGRLITVCEQFPGASADWCSISPPNVEDSAARSRSIQAIGIGRDWPFHLATPEGNVGIIGGLATPGLFQALGVHAELGRLIQSSDLLGRESTVALLTHAMWQTRFGGDRAVIGRIVTIDGSPVQIVGVLPAGLALPKYEHVELWRPLHIDPRDETHRDWRGFVAFGRLRPGVTIASARADLAGVAEQLRKEHFATTAVWGLQLKSLQDLVVGNVKPVLLVFLGAVSLVLLVACANVANLLLARATARRSEIALRSALGAGRWRIVRELLVESLILAVAGAALGVIIAGWGTSAFKAMAPSGIPRVDQVGVDGGVLLFALLLAVATTIVFGLVPALRVARVDLAQALREGGRSSSSGKGRLGRLLVVGQLALALTLTVGAGLLMRSFVSLTAWNPGFEREHLLTFTLFAPAAKYPDRARLASMLDRIETELASVPGVQGVGSASSGPLFGGGDGTDDMRFKTAGGGEQRAPAAWFDVSPSFFGTLGVGLVRGRNLDASDRLESPRVALVNESLAQRFWPNESPLGKQLTLFDGRFDVTVVGVVRDVRPMDPTAPVPPEVYWSNRQEPRGFTYVVLRTTTPPASVVAAVRDRLRLIDRDLEPKSVRTMAELMALRLKNPRFDMLLLVAFGVSALALAAIGTYGLFAYMVSRRSRELGIRLALGAAQRQIVIDVLRDGLMLAVGGVVVGTVASVALARAMRGMVFGVSTFDPLTVAGSAVLLLVIAIGACWAPARRAARVDPVVTLTAE